MEYKHHQSPEFTEAPSPGERRRWRVAQRLWRAESIYFIALAAFAVLALFARLYPYFNWDLRATRFLQGLPVPGLFALMRAVSAIGDHWHPVALMALTVSALFLCNLRHEAAGLLFSAGLGDLINRLLKFLIARPRPTPALVSVFRPLTSQSFPSGHVTFYVCYFGFLFFVAYALLPAGSLIRRLALLLTVLPILLVGLSRIYLGEHWLSDTLGAYLMGGIWLGVSLHIYRRWKEKAAARPSE